MKLLFLCYFLLGSVFCYSGRIDCIIKPKGQEEVKGTMSWSIAMDNHYKKLIKSPKRITIKTGKKKRNFSPSDVEYYKLKMDDQWFTYYSKEVFKDQYVFCERKVTGVKSLYFWSSTGAHPYYFSTLNFIITDSRKNSLPYWHTLESFGKKNRLIKYFKDCPELAMNIDEKYYNWKSIDGLTQIISAYNEKCTEKP